MNDETRFHGWANRETWALALHLSNTERMQAIACEMASPRNNYAGTIREWIEECHEMMFYPVPGDPPVAEDVRLMLADVGSLYRVDWYEVEQHFAEIAREIEED